MLGVEYDRALLELADRLAAAAAGAPVDRAGARSLIEAALDGGRITACEERTLQHIAASGRVSPGAAELLRCAAASSDSQPAEAPPASAAADATRSSAGSADGALFRQRSRDARVEEQASTLRCT